MKVIGITGPSGAGKTTLSKIMEKEFNTSIINADEVARSLSTNPETEYFKKIVELFGNDILKSDGNLDRKQIANLIYKNSNKRKQLNSLTFKYVVDDISLQIQNIKAQNKYDFIAIDVPLLYEANMEKICDKVIAVVAEDEEKISRICERDKIDREMARQRLKIQNNNEFFAKKADFVIHNNGTIDNLVNSLKEIMNRI